MTKLICLFNHKGGVSKTTTAFNLGWTLALKGKRVLLADFDPQCNLTGMALGFTGVDDLDEFYRAMPANNVKDALAPAFESQPRPIAAAECMQIKGVDNLYLLPGHIGLSEYETTLGIAQELSGSLLPLRNLPGSIRHMLTLTAEKYAVDYVIIDMSPSLGALNQNLLTTSDHFIVPLHPDYFSSMALTSLARTLPKWQSWAKTAYGIDVLKNADYPFIQPHAKFIGAVIQKYRPRNGRASKAFQRWIDQLSSGLKNILIPALQGVDLIDADNFSKKINMQPWEPILEVADFNSLIAISQEHQVPIYMITADQAQQTGAVWDQTEASMAAFGNSFFEFADRVIALTE